MDESNSNNSLNRTLCHFASLMFEWGLTLAFSLFWIFVGISAFDNWRLVKVKNHAIIELQTNNENLQKENDALQKIVFLLLLDPDLDSKESDSKSEKKTMETPDFFNAI